MTDAGTRTPTRVPEWARKVAGGLGEGPHVVVSGISVSGNIHAGNLREVLVAEAVAEALRERGDTVRFIFHADTIDPLRKIAPGIPARYEEFIGHSLSHVPDPEGCHVSYAEHFLAPFEEALREMDMDIEVLRSHELYEGGVYTKVTREALDRTEDLRLILQDVTNRKMPEHWSPFSPRSSSGKLTGMRVLEHVPGSTSVVFADEDGFEEAADYSKGEGKLGWRVELAARWKALGVTFEPFGKDHTTSGGSTETADRMSREVFEYPVPGRYQYEWIGLKGQGDMSSSRGIVLLPKDLLRIMPPDAVRRIILGRDPARRFDLDLGEGFPRFMDEFRAERGEEHIVPFIHLVTVAQTVGENADAASRMLSRGGYERVARDTAELARWLAYALNWAGEWAPEAMKIGLLSPEESREVAAGLDDEQRGYLAAVAAKLGPEMDGEEIQDLLYSTAVDRGLKPKRAFAAVYKVLIGKTSGPKAGPFVAGLPPEEVRRRFRC